MIKFGDQDVLLVIDVQNDFCQAGALAVPCGDDIVPLINGLAKNSLHIVLTQDWHPYGHSSFASAHPGHKPYDTISMPHGDQILWPDHCVQNTFGAAFHPGLVISQAELILRKGYHRNIDSYSAFYENDHKTSTGLAAYLRARGLSRIWLAGLATDYCIAWSALDARREGFEVMVIEDACRAIDLNGSLAKAVEVMRDAGVVIVQSGFTEQEKQLLGTIAVPRPLPLLKELEAGQATYRIGGYRKQRTGALLQFSAVMDHIKGLPGAPERLGPLRHLFKAICGIDTGFRDKLVDPPPVGHRSRLSIYDQERRALAAVVMELRIRAGDSKSDAARTVARELHAVPGLEDLVGKTVAKWREVVVSGSVEHDFDKRRYQLMMEELEGKFANQPRKAADYLIEEICSGRRP